MTNDQSVVVLFKGGRLPSWHQLTDQQRHEYEQIHVDLMLSIAHDYDMTRLEGFKLITPQLDWQRFWLLEFPTFEGAEEWVKAEMAPPYGLFGHYEYHFSRPLMPAVFSSWVSRPASPVVPLESDPHEVPPLSTDDDSFVLILFARYRPGAEGLSAEERGDAEHETTMRSIAKQVGLTRLEGFQLLTPQADWHRAWIVELPTVEAVETWVAGEESLPHGMHTQRTFYLTRKWAPRYFATWVRQ